MAFKKRVRELVYEKLDGRCAYCGESIHLKQMQVDHIIPRFNFELYITSGKHVPPFLTHLTLDDVNHIDNLHPACRVCNNYKDTFGLEPFRNELGKQLERAQKYSKNYRMAKKYGQLKETPQPIIFYYERNDKT